MRHAPFRSSAARRPGAAIGLLLLAALLLLSRSWFAEEQGPRTVDARVGAEQSTATAPADARPPTDGDGVAPVQADLRYGLLQPLDADRFRSPAGLIYGPGSAEGHRLQHLQRHTADRPDRPGPHGVFDGGMPQALRTIDEAYRLAISNTRTATRRDRGRTIHTVDLEKRVGYVGGRDGARRGKPAARSVRIVLEGNRVITAYPMQ